MSPRPVPDSPLVPLAALNTTGIRTDMQDEFMDIQNTIESLFQSENYGEIESEMFLSSPTYHSAAVYLMQHSNSKYENYNELLFGKPEGGPSFPTGTCLPKSTCERSVFHKNSFHYCYNATKIIFWKIFSRAINPHNFQCDPLFLNKSLLINIIIRINNQYISSRIQTADIYFIVNI